MVLTFVWVYAQQEDDDNDPGATTLLTLLRKIGAQKPAEFYEQLIYGDSSYSSSDSDDEAVLSGDEDIVDA